MTKAIYRKTPTGFAPTEEGGQSYWARFDLGDELLLTFTKPRSLPQLKLYWSLAGIVYDNSDVFASRDEVSDSIKLACGLSQTTHVKFKGQWYERKTPSSISFENMPQDEFNTFFEKALVYITTELVPGLDVDTLGAEIRAAA